MKQMIPRNHHLGMSFRILSCLLISGAVSLSGAEPSKFPLAGADEKTPSLSHYFSWIDNTNEGATEHQTLANLEFFKWLHDEYGKNGVSVQILTEFQLASSPSTHD